MSSQGHYSLFNFGHLGIIIIIIIIIIVSVETKFKL